MPIIDRDELPDTFACMWRLILAVTLIGCSPADQESVRTVAAIEVLLKRPQDTIDLVAILKKHTAQYGLHVDDESFEWREFERRAQLLPPEHQATFKAGVWLGENDDELVAFAGDGGHRARVWILFLRGIKPDRFKAYREATISSIRDRWPEAKFLPILPGGGIPNVRDLVVAKGEYRILRSSASTYELSPALPIFAEK